MFVTFLLILVSFLSLSLDFYSADKLTNLSPTMLWIEHVAVLFISITMIFTQLKQYPKKYVIRFINVFLFSYILSLLILHFNWIPYLEIDVFDEIAFDPQRYYEAASMYVNKDFESEQLNYVGVVYFYVIIFRIFGLDPLVPLFVNELFSLYALLLITKIFTCEDKDNIKYFLLLSLIPEVVYFNVLSSREVLSMSLATIICCKLYHLQSKNNLFDIVIVFASFFLLAIIRTPFAMASALGFFSFILFSKKRSKSTLFWGLLVIIVGGYAGINFSESLGSTNDAEYLEQAIERKTGGDNEAVEEFGYSSNSFTKKLIPHNLVEFVIFGFIRSFLYLIPSPVSIRNPLLTLRNLIGFSTFSYTELTTIAMFIFVVFLFLKREFLIPYYKSHKLFVIYYLVFFFVVGMFNTIIVQQRYRIVSDLLFFALCIDFVSYTKKIKRKKNIAGI